MFDLLGGLFRAEGGPVTGGQPYIVGERGPELFVPSGTGSIIPNGGAVGGTAPAQQPQNINNTYISNNISALDARSVAQLFAENRKTLLGTIQLAQKELPYSNR